METVLSFSSLHAVRSLAPSIALALLAGCGASGARPSSAPEGTYYVRLSRPIAVGASWVDAVELHESTRQRMEVGGQTVRDERTTLALTIEAQITALEVDARGSVTRYSLAVRELVADVGQGPTSPTIPGTLVVTRGTPGTIESPEGPLDEQTEAWLRKAFPMRAPTDIDDDAIFGTDAPQPIGAVWSVHTERAARGLSDMGIQVSHDHVGGETRLIGTARLDGVDCLEVASDFSARELVVPGLPAGADTRRAELRAHMDATVPVDTTLPVPRETTRMVMEVEIEVPTPGGPALVHITDEESKVRVRSAP